MKSSEQNVQQFVILQTGGVADALRSVHIDYPAMFLRLLTDAGMDPGHFTTVDVRTQPLPQTISADAYLITGSAHSVYQDLPWIAPLAAFVEQVLASGRPVVGICFGHQLLAHFFGGTVARSPTGWRVGVQHNTLVAHPGWMTLAAEADPDGFSILVSHEDQVLALPDNARLLATHPYCEFAAFTMTHPGGGCALAVQGHPEFDKAYLRALLQERRVRLGESVFAEGIGTLVEPTTEALVGTWIKCFLEQPATALSNG